MRRLCVFVLLVSICGLGLPASSWAIEFYFAPDTTYGNVGDTISLSGRITASDTLRGFTIYMVYDTNEIDLAAPPLPGTLIAGRQGLDFRYADHIPSAPDWLEVGATVFSNDFWAGPGELFTIRFALRQCADAVMTADVGFRRPDATFILGEFNPPFIQICAVVPQAASNLVINRNDPSSVILLWNSVTQDTAGNPLQNPPVYNVVRQQILPTEQPAATIATVPDTFYVDTYDAAEEYIYYIVTQTSP